MLTHKQRWRRVRQTSRKSASLATGHVSAADAATGGGVPNSMKSLSIGDNLLQLLGVKARSCYEEGPPSKDTKGTRGGAYCPVGGVVPVGTYSIGKVSFNQRVQVVFIPTRPELASIKADIWWEDQDYANFR